VTRAGGRRVQEEAARCEVHGFGELKTRAWSEIGIMVAGLADAGTQGRRDGQRCATRVYEEEYGHRSSTNARVWSNFPQFFVFESFPHGLVVHLADTPYSLSTASYRVGLADTGEPRHGHGLFGGPDSFRTSACGPRDFRKTGRYTSASTAASTAASTETHVVASPPVGTATRGASVASGCCGARPGAPVGAGGHPGGESRWAPRAYERGAASASAGVCVCRVFPGQLPARQDAGDWVVREGESGGAYSDWEQGGD